MTKEKKNLLSDDFLDELAKEISQLYGGPTKEQNDIPDATKMIDFK